MNLGKTRQAEEGVVVGIVDSIDQQNASPQQHQSTTIMALGDPNRGWSDPIGTFMRLQLSVKILASGKGQRKVRMDEATSALTGLIPEYFPAALRERAERVLSVRDRVRRERGSNLVSFRFDLLKGEEYAALTQDILILYEVCIFDMSKEIRDIVHPNDE